MMRAMRAPPAFFMEMIRNMHHTTPSSMSFIIIAEYVHYVF